MRDKLRPGDATEIRSQLNSQRFCLVSGALPPRFVARLRELCGAFYSLAKLSRGDETLLEFGTPELAGALRQALTGFVELNNVPGSVALINATLAAAPLAPILEALVGSPRRMEPTSYVRITDRGSGSPNYWHQDDQFVSAPSLTVWIPLVPCGDDTPAIQFAPMAAEGLAALANDPSCLVDVAGTKIFRDEAVQQWVLGGTPVRPSFVPGDVALFDGLCVHGTNARESMTKPRISIDLRLHF